MIFLPRLTLLWLVVAVLLSPFAVRTVSADVGKVVDETLGAIRMAATMDTAMFDARNGVRRHYTPIFVTQTAPPARISDMAQEGIDARTYGGMHFRGASRATAVVGAQIADYVLANAARSAADHDDADQD